LAHVLVGKYCDHLPLYRQSVIHAREKVDLHRSTLTDWVGRSTTLLEPLATHIGKLVRAGPALFADDTPVKMQSKGRAQTARLWSYVRDERPWCGQAPPCAWYQMEWLPPSRDGIAMCQCRSVNSHTTERTAK
jgi:hypothetical protein